jgi:hypothetical protein
MLLWFNASDTCCIPFGASWDATVHLSRSGKTILAIAFVWTHLLERRPSKCICTSVSKGTWYDRALEQVLWGEVIWTRYTGQQVWTVIFWLDVPKNALALSVSANAVQWNTCQFMQGLCLISRNAFCLTYSGEVKSKVFKLLVWFLRMSFPKMCAGSSECSLNSGEWGLFEASDSIHNLGNPSSGCWDIAKIWFWTFLGTSCS